MAGEQRNHAGSCLGKFVFVVFLWSMTMLCFLSCVASFMQTSRRSRSVDVDDLNNARTISVVVNPSASAWVSDAALRFNLPTATNEQQERIFVNVREQEAGDSIARWREGEPLPDVWIADHEVWVEIAAETLGRSMPVCSSTSRTPLVIATWKPLAESLGWPARELGWLDFGSLAADETAWAYYSGGQFGKTMRLEHAHPGLAGSGVFTLLAIIHAAQGQQQQAVTPADISSPIVQASVRAFESAVAKFSLSTSKLAETMEAQGPQGVSAVVLYESMAFTLTREDVALIYPFEGTFMATNPACALSEDGQAFVDYLLSPEAQEQLAQFGLLPPTGESGVPVPLFPPPHPETVQALQEVWLSERKPVNLVMAIDVSGSMRGKKIESVQRAVADFIANMGENDRISIILFADQPVVWVYAAPIAEKRDTLIENVQRIEVGGGTALYDAVFEAVQLARQSSAPEYTNALIVLTDGRDTASERLLTVKDPELITLINETDVTIFTVAFGEDVAATPLKLLAKEGKGSFYRANETSIEAIYAEMSAAFGSAAGIGR
ncbi:MAG: VWA domain-containing protein [Ardenticatenia bacterium]|nr:MAG: VWA domain-containing protein [Ardenticatenia bacterium]